MDQQQTKPSATKSSSATKKKQSGAPETTTSATATTTTKMKTARTSNRRLELISLNAAITTLLVSLLQFYLIWHRVKQVDSLWRTVSRTADSSLLLASSSSSSSAISFILAHSITSAQIHASIVVSRLVLALAALFAISYTLTSPFKIGIKAHDNFKLGKNLDHHHYSSSSSSSSEHTGHRADSTTTTTCSTCDDEDDGDVLSSGARSSSSSSSSFNSSSVRERVCSRLSRFCRSAQVAHVWSELPPLGASCHLTAALLILVVDLLVAAVQIQLGLVPAGNVFVTKLDFIYGRPIDRQFTLGDMFASKDDFTHLSQLDVVSLDYFNYALAVVLYALKVTQPFWSTSRRFTALMLLQTVTIALLMLNSYGALEIVIKAAMLKRISRSMLLINFNWHVWETVAVYLTSFMVLHLNLWMLAKWGFRQAQRQQYKFQFAVHAYLSNRKKIAASYPSRLCLATMAESSASSMGTMSGTSNNTSEDSRENDLATKQHQQRAEKSDCKEWTCLRCIQLSYSYSLHFASAALFLIYCSLRSILVYDTFATFKLTGDLVLIVSLVFEAAAVLVWLVGLVLISKRRVEWAFDLHATYRVMYWNKAYEDRRRRARMDNDADTIMVMLATAAASGGASLRGHKRAISTGRINVATTSEDITRTSEINDASISTITIKENDPAHHQLHHHHNHNYQNQKKNGHKQSHLNHPVLLVRDDSIMSKSGKMSTSSITEVSSLMTSTVGATTTAMTRSGGSAGGIGVGAGVGGGISMKQLNADTLRLKTYQDPLWTMRQKQQQLLLQQQQHQQQLQQQQVIHHSHSATLNEIESRAVEVGTSSSSETNVSSSSSSSSSSSTMIDDKASPSPGSTTSSASACSNTTTAVDSGRDSFIDSSSPANSALSAKYNLVGLPYQLTSSSNINTKLGLDHLNYLKKQQQQQQQIHKQQQQQQTVILGPHNPQYLDTHC